MRKQTNPPSRASGSAETPCVAKTDGTASMAAPTFCTQGPSMEQSAAAQRSPNAKAAAESRPAAMSPSFE